MEEGRPDGRKRALTSFPPNVEKVGGAPCLVRLSDGLSVGALGPGSKSRSGDEAVGILAESLA